jgi:hypothetical protein
MVMASAVHPGGREFNPLTAHQQNEGVSNNPLFILRVGVKRA